MKALFIVVIFLVFQNSFSMEAESVCPQVLSEESSDIDALANSLKMPDGNACLSSQLNELTIGPFVQDADFCACKDDYKKHKEGIGSISSESESIKVKIQEQVEISTMKAFRSKLYEVQDSAIAIDTMIRNQDLTELDAYKVKECTANKLWEVIEKIKSDKRKDCQSLERRIAYLTSSEETEPIDAMGDLKNELIRLTNAVNENSKLSQSHNLPLRAFYSIQINQIPETEEIASMYDYVDSGIPARFNESEATILANARFQRAIESNVSISELSQKAAKKMHSSYQEEADALRRNPILRMILQEEEGQEIAMAIHQIGNDRDDKIDELIDVIIEEKEEEGIELDYKIDKWPQEIRNELALKRLEIEEEAKLKSHELLNNKETIKIALGIQDKKCKEIFNEVNIKNAFCGELNPPDKVIREIVLPETMKHLDSESDVLGLSIAVNDLYCNPFREPSKVYSALDLENTFQSFLEQISTDSNQEFARFDQGVAPILSRFMEDGVLTDEEKEIMIPELASFLVENGNSDLSGKLVVADTEEERQAALASAEQLLRGNVTGELSNVVDRGLARSLREIIERPGGVSAEPVHEQGTVEGLFAQSETGETGLASNYALTATDEDRSRARTVAREVAVAESEGREVNQDIVAANSFRPRNLNTGEIIPNARAIVMPTPVAEGGVAEVESLPVSPAAESGPDRRIASRDPVPSPDPQISQSESRTASRTSERPAQSSPERRVAKSRAGTPSTSRSDALRRDIIEAEARVDRRQRELDRLVSRGESTTNNDELRAAVEDLRRSQDRVREMARSTVSPSRGPAQRLPDSRNTFAQSGLTPPTSRPYNPFTESGAEARFPSVIEDEERVATALSGPEAEKKTKKIGGRGGSSKSGKARSPASGGGGVIGGSVPGLPNGGVIKGFEGFKLGTCAAPTLFYIFPCFVKNDVFYEFNEIDVEYDDPKEIGKKVEHPSEMVSSLGLERKTWIKIKDLGINKKTEEEEVLVTTYDWFPPMLEDVDKLNDEAWRNEKISEVLANRWNWLFIREVSRETRILEQKVYDKRDFDLLMDERKMSNLIKSTAGELYQNVNSLNVRVAQENKSKIDKLKRSIASEKK